jgi:CHAD domain-containing protein
MTTRPSTKVTVPLKAEDRSDRAVGAVLRGLLEIFEANLEEAIGSDPEALHDLRVSLRRSRSVLGEFRGVFLPDELRAFREGFRRLQGVTGRARDLDVQMEELTAMSAAVPQRLQADLHRLRDVLEAKRQVSRAEMARALRSDPAVSLIAEWRRFLDGLAESAGNDRPGGHRPIGRLAGKRIRRAYRRMVKRGSRIRPGSPSEPYHELRKEGKELRYLLELFATPLYPEEVVKPIVSSLKGLQDVLGRHQDRETQIETLNRLGAEGTEGGPAPVDPELIELLVEELVSDKLAARQDFGARFERFAQTEQHHTVKRVFR